MVKKKRKKARTPSERAIHNVRNVRANLERLKKAHGEVAVDRAFRDLARKGGA
jgi:hypothetical protein